MLAAWLVGIAACSVATDAQYYPPVTPQAFALTKVTLPLPTDQPQPLNPTITLSLSDLPDPATVQFPALQLGPRGRAIEYLVAVSLVDRQLVLRPKNPLLPETDYVVQLSQDLRALSGQRLDPPAAVLFHTGSFVQPTPTPPSPVTLAQLLLGAAGLRARCATAGCHLGGSAGPAAQGLDFSLPAAQLQAQLTHQPALGSLEGLLLVQPGLPEQSYLLRKLVAGSGFARISGDPMPPVGAPVDPATLQALELWIRQGAK